MSKTFTYTRITSQYYLDYTDEWEEDGEDFDYEVDDDKLMDAVIELIKRDFFGCKVSPDALSDFIAETDILDRLVDNYEDELKAMFKQEAFDYYDYR